MPSGFSLTLRLQYRTLFIVGLMSLSLDSVPGTDVGHTVEDGILFLSETGDEPESRRHFASIRYLALDVGCSAVSPVVSSIPPPNLPRFLLLGRSLSWERRSPRRLVENWSTQCFIPYPVPQPGRLPGLHGEDRDRSAEAYRTTMLRSQPLFR